MIKHEESKKFVSNLSPLQSGLLFHSLYSPESDAYHAQIVLEIEGSINVDIFKNAVSHLMTIYPNLKTGFEWQGNNTPYQYISRTANIPVYDHDWNNFSKVNQSQMIVQFLKEDRKKRFVLEKPPLFRVSIILCAKNHFFIVWSQHVITAEFLFTKFTS